MPISDTVCVQLVFDKGRTLCLLSKQRPKIKKQLYACRTMLAGCLLVCYPAFGGNRVMAEQLAIQSLGGKARAKKLSKEDRSAIAKNAAEARWEKEGHSKPLPKATHEGILMIGNMEIPCAVLEDGRR